MANIDQLELPNGTTYDIDAKTVNGHTVAKDVPSDAVFTDKNVEQIVSTGESGAFLRILTSPFQTETSETITSSVAASDFATISAQRKTIQLDGGQLLARDSRDSTKYLIFSGDNIYNHKTWDGNNTDLTDALADKANTADVYTQTQVDNLLTGKQDSLLGGNLWTIVNLDDYRTAGHYWCSNTSVSNLPVAETGMLEVIPKDTATNTAVVQRYTAVSNNTITGVYERVYVSNAWRAWKQVGEDTFLPLAGGTLTGDLTIAKATPTYYTKKTGLTIDTSNNNGVSTDVSSYTIHADSTNLYFGRFRSTAYSDGRVASLVDARNMKSDGDRVANYLAVGVNKDGSRYFAFPNDSDGDGRKAFREAIAIQDTPTVLEPDITSSQTVSTGNYKSLGNFTLTTGTWIVSYKAEFSANASGLRRIMLTSSSGSNSPTANSRITAHAALNGVIDIGWTTMIRVTGTSVTRYLTAYQNSGSDLTVTGYVKAIKVINV